MEGFFALFDLVNRDLTPFRIYTLPGVVVNAGGSCVHWECVREEGFQYLNLADVESKSAESTCFPASKATTGYHLVRLYQMLYNRAVLSLCFFFPLRFCRSTSSFRTQGTSSASWAATGTGRARPPPSSKQ